jgi:hypothetical protein
LLRNILRILMVILLVAHLIAKRHGRGDYNNGATS